MASSRGFTEGTRARDDIKKKNSHSTFDKIDSRVAGHALDVYARLDSQVFTQNAKPAVRHYRYDADGNTELYYVHVDASANNGLREERYSWYDAEGRVRGAEYRSDIATDNSPYIVHEDYRYDPLGRRYWVRTDRFMTYGDRQRASNRSELRRILWDGDREEHLEYGT